MVSLQTRHWSNLSRVEFCGDRQHAVLPDLRRAAKLGLIPLHPIGRCRHLDRLSVVFGQQPVAQYDAAEIRPLALVLNRDHEFAIIGAGERPLRRDARVFEVNPLRLVAAVAGLADRVPPSGRRRVEERHLHEAAATCALALQQCLQDADDGVHAGRDVAQRHAELVI